VREIETEVPTGFRRIIIRCGAESTDPPRSKTIAMSDDRAELQLARLMSPPFRRRRASRTLRSGKNEARPCPVGACKHHLYLDINPDNRLDQDQFPDPRSWEMAHTCASVSPAGLAHPRGDRGDHEPYCASGSARSIGAGCSSCGAAREIPAGTDPEIQCSPEPRSERRVRYFGSFLRPGGARAPEAASRAAGRIGDRATSAAARWTQRPCEEMQITSHSLARRATARASLRRRSRAHDLGCGPFCVDRAARAARKLALVSRLVDLVIVFDDVNESHRRRSACARTRKTRAVRRTSTGRRTIDDVEIGPRLSSRGLWRHADDRLLRVCTITPTKPGGIPFRRGRSFCLAGPTTIARSTFSSLATRARGRPPATTIPRCRARSRRASVRRTAQLSRVISPRSGKSRSTLFFRGAARNGGAPRRRDSRSAEHLPRIGLSRRIGCVHGCEVACRRVPADATSRAAASRREIASQGAVDRETTINAHCRPAISLGGRSFRVPSGHCPSERHVREITSKSLPSVPPRTDQRLAGLPITSLARTATPPSAARLRIELGTALSVAAALSTSAPARPRHPPRCGFASAPRDRERARARAEGR